MSHAYFMSSFHFSPRDGLFFGGVFQSSLSQRYGIRNSKQESSHYSQRDSIQKSWRYYDLVGADIPRLCTKLTIPVRVAKMNTNLAWRNAASISCPSLIKRFYPNRFKQIGLILRSIYFNPWMVFVSSTRKGWTWEGISLCVIEIELRWWQSNTLERNYNLYWLILLKKKPLQTCFIKASEVRKATRR